MGAIALKLYNSIIILIRIFIENNTATASGKLFDQAISRLMEDMQVREIGAILWDNATAGFHYIPETTVTDKKGEKKVIRVMGLYIFDNTLYLIEEGMAPVELTEFYTDGVEVPPTVVTLTEDSAMRHLGDPTKEKGFTTNASDEEWLAIADCYFEALAEE